MTADKIREVTAMYRTMFSVDLELTPVRQPPDTERNHTIAQVVEHCYAMLDEIDSFVRDGRLEKAFHWLGFIQGCLWTCGFCSIAELKAHNKP